MVHQKLIRRGHFFAASVRDDIGTRLMDDLWGKVLTVDTATFWSYIRNTQDVHLFEARQRIPEDDGVQRDGHPYTLKGGGPFDSEVELYDAIVRARRETFASNVLDSDALGNQSSKRARSSNDRRKHGILVEQEFAAAVQDAARCARNRDGTPHVDICVVEAFQDLGFAVDILRSGPLWVAQDRARMPPRRQACGGDEAAAVVPESRGNARGASFAPLA